MNDRTDRDQDYESVRWEESLLNARECLELANKDQIHPNQLYEFFAQQVPRLTVIYLKSENGRKPLLSKSNRPDGKYVVAFTDIEAARKVVVQYPQFLEISEEPALPFLIKAFRSDSEGVVLNPGFPSRLFLVKQHLSGFILEYATQKLSQLPGAWIPTHNDNFLLVEYKPGAYTTAIYSSEKDANYVAQKAGGKVVLHPWNLIFERCATLNAPAPYLHFGLPEQNLLTPEQVHKIMQGPKMGYVEPVVTTYPFISTQPQVEHISPSQVISTPPLQSEIKPAPVESPISNHGDVPTNHAPFTTPEVQTVLDQAPKVDTSEKLVPNIQVQQDPVVVEENKKIEDPVPFPDKPIDDRNSSTAIPIEKQELQNKETEEILNKDIVTTEKPIEKTMESSVSSSVTESKEVTRTEELLKHQDEPVNDVSSPVTKQEPSEVKQQAEVPPIRQGNQQVAPDVKTGLERLERATIAGQGSTNAWEVCQVLAEIRRIWVIADPDGNMVILAGQDQTPIVDFFTSDSYAYDLIQEAKQQNPKLPKMTPRLVSTKKLYRALASRHTIVWINRTSSIAWTSPMGDTLPYVLQLMMQMEREKN